MTRLIDAGALMNDAVIHRSATTNESCITVDAVDDAPTIDAEPVRHGKWKDIRVGIGTCSECGERYGSVDVMNYCPNCGARMDIV